MKSGTVQYLDPTVGQSTWWGRGVNVEMLDTTFPNPIGMQEYGAAIARSLVEFEAYRRGTMIVLALQGYRLEHGELPETLQALARRRPPSKDPFSYGEYGSRSSRPEQAFFEFIPLDPFSGDEFRYFPQGIPDLPKQPEVLSPNASFIGNGTDNSLADTIIEWKDKSIVAGVPGIWSTGPDLIGREVEEHTFNPQTMALERSTPQLYYWLRWPGYEQRNLPIYQAWGKGIWFPVPAAQKNDRAFRQGKSGKTWQPV